MSMFINTLNLPFLFLTSRLRRITTTIRAKARTTATPTATPATIHPVLDSETEEKTLA